MTFVEAPTFRRTAAKLLTLQQRATLEGALTRNPEAGAIIRGSGGLRDVRIPRVRGTRRSPSRAIYLWLTGDTQVLLLYAYVDNAPAPISPSLIREQRAAR